MLENYNKFKLLKVFLDSPTDNFRLRELSRLSNISPPSVINYLKDLEKEKFIERYTKRDIPFYKAKRENNKFILYKKISIIQELDSSGLIDFIWDKASPDVIILYGSYAKGESIESSDVDLFIIGKEKELNLDSFEEKINKRIHIIFEDNIKNIPKELKNNLINGTILKGYLKVF
jgi:predicted nucleotidyltransferase